jgi:hypothetical protein
MSGELHAAQGFPLTLRDPTGKQMPAWLFQEPERNVLMGSLSKGERKAFFNGLVGRNRTGWTQRRLSKRSRSRIDTIETS